MYRSLLSPVLSGATLSYLNRVLLRPCIRKGCECSWVRNTIVRQQGLSESAAPSAHWGVWRPGEAGPGGGGLGRQLGGAAQSLQVRLQRRAVDALPPHLHPRRATLSAGARRSTSASAHIDGHSFRE